ncbi:hypothetical protein SPRG_04406 [Saprolegnia parasitica CBS 223.65]|uniref:Coatomer subunit zeta n=1 Tax=Saprolegnia parasitica (strain CBS 223.65) TaxID=695850 RepID=A0A067CID5_SAPPC|nr:hypothetical protein SPRG_04406 [Saprolegnia parasitica CBS 223.65]KDO30504.1 hypothetical protein SPRG_04406 [Saprolegnia parasitica CBS 223.65]|eukprot:XP_012198721.1 hypothetical protein SPRG_04406 [Saprolegnia parasitica CBS 223.65]
MHSAIVTTEKGHVLLARYFHATTTEEKRVYEQALFGAVPWPALASTESATGDAAFLAVCDSQYVVYRKLGDLVWFLAGGLEYDELTLHDTLVTIQAVAATHMEKRCTEALFLAHHSKIVVALDDMVHEVACDA